MSIDLLKILEKNCFESLEEVVQNLYISFREVQKVDLLPSNEDFYYREEILNSYRDFLLEIFQSEKASTKLKELILRVILVIADLRSSGEDYLIVYNILCSESLSFNVEKEIFMNEYFSKNLTISDKNKAKFDLNNNSSDAFKFFLKHEECKITPRLVTTQGQEFIYLRFKHCSNLNKMKNNILVKICYKRSFS